MIILIILKQDEQDEHHAHHAHCDHFWFKRSEWTLQDFDYSMIIQSLLLHNLMQESFNKQFYDLRLQRHETDFDVTRLRWWWLN